MQGAQGPQGLQGPAGIQGPVGPAGMQGPQGTPGPAIHLLNQFDEPLGYLASLSNPSGTTPGSTEGCDVLYAHQDAPASSFPEGKIVALEKPTLIYYAQSGCAGQAYVIPYSCLNKIRSTRVLYPSPWTLSNPSLYSELFQLDGAVTLSFTVNSQKSVSGSCVNTMITINARPVSLSIYKINLTTPWDMEVF
jgi:hypothetical protein